MHDQLNHLRSLEQPNNIPGTISSTDSLSCTTTPTDYQVSKNSMHDA